MRELCLCAAVVLGLWACGPADDQGNCYRECLEQIDDEAICAKQCCDGDCSE